VDFSDQRDQFRLPQAVTPPPQKTIVATGADLQNMATQTNRELISVTIHEHVPHPDSLAKNAAAFPVNINRREDSKQERPP
jgi:hypothetical protein